ncbi:MAG: phosphoribosylformylglycinamidine synthase subunit PurL [Dehalococcoidia bacterium]|nr:phosphoribosylformylglycinamidine synthase subunit PurL [Dehalococcoidia bacterium]
MTHRIEVAFNTDLIDPREDGIMTGIRDLGVFSIQRVLVADVYWLDGALSPAQLDVLCGRLLSDPVAQKCRYDGGHVRDEESCLRQIEVTYNNGVTDTLQDTILKGIQDLDIGGVSKARSGTRYVLYGSASESELDVITNRLLLNPIVQHVVREGEEIFPYVPVYELEQHSVPLLNLQPQELSDMAARFGFFQTEMRAILDHFSELGRDPTDIELETLAQSWSEHCVHKTFKARINVEGETIENLLRSTIMKATGMLNKDWCLSVFKDNAGVIDFDGQNAICFKVETHNHPSAVEPYGGAATGLGGVVRDVLGTGLGAFPILNTDVFCFARPDYGYDSLPAGILHPRTVFKGVRAGVADYGNRLGIPTINGTVRFDDRYLGNPLVFCGTAGIMPVWAAQQGLQEPGDLVVLVGGRTGRDGIHGVTFASEKLDEQSSLSSRSAVQIGNPIVEKKTIDVLMVARDRRLYRRTTDCGGGGLSSAVGEMGAETGVRVYLDRVPLKYSGLSHDEIWISESQERMILAVPPECCDELLELCRGEAVEATIIGEFTDNHRLELLYDDVLVGDLEMDFLHDGRPQLELMAAPPKPRTPVVDPPPAASMEDALTSILSSLNVCSKEWVVRQYDHEVQGGSVLKPLVGVEGDGPGDASVIRPVLGSTRGLAVSNGINTLFGDTDAYAMAASAIDEALRQIVAVGGSLERVALLDNFCWGSVSEPETLWALVEACRACHDLSLAYGAPFISGKDSLNNFTEIEGQRISIPHTLLVSAISVVPDVRKVISMDLKEAGNLLFIVGNTYGELAGSEYSQYLGEEGANVPRVRPETALQVMTQLQSAIASGYVKACHDLSEGGVGVAASEMAFAGHLGVTLSLDKVPLGEKVTRDDIMLFSESNSRFLVEVSAGDVQRFEELFTGLPCAIVGVVQESQRLRVTGLEGTTVLDCGIDSLRTAWKRPLDW